MLFDLSSVADLDPPEDPDPYPDLSVRGMDPDPAPDLDLNPSITKQKKLEKP
jgi:hypothetical protein